MQCLFGAICRESAASFKNILHMPLHMVHIAYAMVHYMPFYRLNFINRRIQTTWHISVHNFNVDFAWIPLITDMISIMILIISWSWAFSSVFLNKFEIAVSGQLCLVSWPCILLVYEWVLNYKHIARNNPVRTGGKWFEW